MSILSVDAAQADWQQTARAWARQAWEQDPQRRNGVYHVPATRETAGYYVVYSNHPYAGYPLLRADELAEIRRQLKAKGIPELAYATYQHIREGFSDALVIGVGPERSIERLINDAMDLCWTRRKQ